MLKVGPDSTFSPLEVQSENALNSHEETFNGSWHCAESQQIAKKSFDTLTRIRICVSVDIGSNAAIRSSLKCNRNPR